MKVRSVIHSWVLGYARTPCVIFFLVFVFVGIEEQPCFGQRNSNDAPRVMLGVRFSGDSALVAYVQPNGPAFKAGLEVGDEIFSVNDNYVLQSSDLVRNLSNSRPGDRVRVEVRRNGEFRFFDLDVMKATSDGQRIATDGTILAPPPEFGMVGEKAPAITVSTWQNLPDNQTRCQLDDYLGKVVVLMLFQTTCAFSEADGMPLMSEFYQRHKDDPDVQFLSVLASFPQSGENTLENGLAMCQKFNLPIPVGLDTSQDIENTVCKQLKALGSPWFVMIDRKGVVALNGIPGDIVDRDVINKIKLGETVMESFVESEAPPVNAGNDDQ